MSTNAQSVFSNRSFSLFYVGQTFSYIGDGLRLIAIPLLVYHLTGSALSIGITYALELLPFSLFGLVGGSLADRLDRRKLMIVCDFIRFATLAVFAIAFARGWLSLTLLYSGIVLISICAAFFMGSQATSIPFMLGKDRATQAVAALLSAETATQMVLPPVGGALFALIGPLPALTVNACTYLISQFSIAAVETFGPEEPSGLPSLRQIASDVARGYRFMWRDPAMRSITALSSFFNFFGFMTGAVFIPFLKRDFGATDYVVGVALGIGAIGAFAGSYVAGRIPSSWTFGRTMTIAYVIDGLLFIPVMFTHNLVVAIFFLSLTNACVLFEIAQIVGWRMRIIPEDMVGRVFGVVRLFSLIGTVPGAILGGWLADHYGARLPVIVSGIGYALVALLVFAFPVVRKEAR